MIKDKEQFLRDRGFIPLSDRWVGSAAVLITIDALTRLSIDEIRKEILDQLLTRLELNEKETLEKEN